MNKWLIGICIGIILLSVLFGGDSLDLRDAFLRGLVGAGAVIPIIACVFLYEKIFKKETETGTVMDNELESPTNIKTTSGFQKKLDNLELVYKDGTISKTEYNKKKKELLKSQEDEDVKQLLRDKEEAERKLDEINSKLAKARKSSVLPQEDVKGRVCFSLHWLPRMDSNQQPFG